MVIDYRKIYSVIQRNSIDFDFNSIIIAKKRNL
jgi:hypothetical protein